MFRIRTNRIFDRSDDVPFWLERTWSMRKSILAGAAAAMILAAFPAAAPAVRAAEGAPIGAWRTTNGCFLAAFLLTEDGRAQAAYLTGERDASAVWTWDGSTLRIASMAFPLDRFSGHVTNDTVEADYVWHDLDHDQLNQQDCVFERYTPFGI